MEHAARQSVIYICVHDVISSVGEGVEEPVSSHYG